MPGPGAGKTKENNCLLLFLVYAGLIEEKIGLKGGVASCRTAAGRRFFTHLVCHDGHFWKKG